MYSCLLIHICWKVDSKARTESLIHTEYLRSGGVVSMIFIVLGSRAVIFFCILLAILGSMGVPPDSSVGIQVLLDVNVTLHGGVERGLMDAAGLHTKEGRLEERLWTLQALVADGAHLPVRQLVAVL